MLSGSWEDEGHLLKVRWHGKEIAQLRVRREDWAIGAFFPESILRWFPAPAEGTVELPSFSPYGPFAEPLPNTYFRGDFSGGSTALLGDRQEAAEALFASLLVREKGKLRQAATKQAAALLLVAQAAWAFRGEGRSPMTEPLHVPAPNPEEEPTKEDLLIGLLRSLKDLGFTPDAHMGSVVRLTQS